MLPRKHLLSRRKLKALLSTANFEHCHCHATSYLLVGYRGRRSLTLLHMESVGRHRTSSESRPHAEASNLFANSTNVVASCCKVPMAVIQVTSLHNGMAQLTNQITPIHAVLEWRVSSIWLSSLFLGSGVCPIRVKVDAGFYRRPTYHIQSISIAAQILHILGQCPLIHICRVSNTQAAQLSTRWKEENAAVCAYLKSTVGRL
ncbi:hypothetical protein DM02DRAFT_3543 [Periconia macrospinosa]|uniref:Uncharacterized protein n=1 Tax=Periconia macrospinosa TaxID=97972 RepID=A0A2V1ED48_9PLEO|nr:hypothetical protein DM02DRAFT_3543 [Periconia macrospinosa]